MGRPRKEVSTVSKTSLNLPADLWKKVRIRALEEDRNAQEIVIEMLEEYLRRPKKGGRSRESKG